MLEKINIDTIVESTRLAIHALYLDAYFLCDSTSVSSISYV